MVGEPTSSGGSEDIIHKNPEDLSLQDLADLSSEEREEVMAVLDAAAEATPLEEMELPETDAD